MGLSSRARKYFSCQLEAPEIFTYIVTSTVASQAVLSLKFVDTSINEGPLGVTGLGSRPCIGTRFFFQVLIS